MNIDIRSNIKNNFKNDDVNSIINSINDSINSNDELILPGLGVLFEIIWKNCDKKMKNDLTTIIKENINK